MIDKIKHKKRIGCDIHKQLIELLKYAQEHETELPERILENEYKEVQQNKENYPDWYLGLVGFCASFGAKYFGGYARDSCRLPRYLTKPRQRRNEWDMAGSDGISRVSAVFRGKSLLTNKMRII